MRAHILNALVPPRCGLCSELAAGPLCARCQRKLRRTATFGAHSLPGLDSAWSAFGHSGVARQLVVTAKFRARPGLLDLAIDELMTRLPAQGLAGTVLVPVPADPWRARRRGFDAAARIAGRLATLCDSQVSDALRRARGAPQAAKRRADRLASRLSIRAAGALGARVTLVDDVVTTGTTLRACADACRRAGAIEVSALTLTRTPLVIGAGSA